MSEYQYYEFTAVDQPLTARQQSELRARSSRATITCNSFINEYNWGDLSGEPLEWMRHYFDAHVYSASWGHCLLMLKLPASCLDQAMLDACLQPAGSDVFEASAAGQHCILTWHFSDEEGEHDRFWTHEDGPGWLSRLLPLRQELLRGDTRPLYLGWLARLCAQELNDEDIEPPLPPGLATLTPAQQALVEFLEIDPDWLQAAAASSPTETTHAAADHNVWLEQQSPAELRTTARLLLEGRTMEAESSLNRRFLDWHRQHSTQPAPSARRTLADIATGYAAAREQRLERERRAQAKAEARRLAERKKYLAGVAANADQIWQEMDTELKQGSGRSYDRALELAKSLAEALAQAGRQKEFRQALERLQQQHTRRPAWVTRLKKAGLLT
ncbi:hypothetical protein [Oceanimonas marisflavi]|uniref:hypothetical protein n=1 Tax=Oceanimonas marisflavi TaxID=2059724 RepID=UPI000D31F842|nr:hypothetical protein [Oceanimonas marisflavi]